MSVIQDIVNGAARYGVLPNDIYEVAGIDQKKLIKPDDRVSLEQGHLVWQEAVRLTENECLGLYLGAATTPAIAGLVGHLMQASKTLGDVFEHVSNFMTVVTNVFIYSSEIKNNTFILYLNPISYWAESYPNSSIQATDQAIAGAINVCKLLTGKNITASTIEFARPKPANIHIYERVLQAPLLFNKPVNKIVFSSDVAKYPVLGYNEDLQALFIKMLTAAKTAAPQSATGMVKDIIAQQFYNSIPTIDNVARVLNTTPRTLQRKLQKEHTGFQKISDGFKHEQALGLLTLNKYAISEIAYMLGYAEPAVFRRALRRFTGKTPKQIRQEVTK